MHEGFDLPPQDQLALIRSYVGQLSTKRVLIEELWQRVQTRPDDHAALADLHLHVHRIAGSAGPYGLSSLGDAARTLDRALAPLSRREQLPAEPAANGSMNGQPAVMPQSLVELAPLVTVLLRTMQVPS